MIFGKCVDCNKKKFLTKHSLIGHHLPPYVRICRKCHDKRHSMRKPYKHKINRKIQKGTRFHKKK